MKFNRIPLLAAGSVVIVFFMNSIAPSKVLLPGFKVANNPGEQVLTIVDEPQDVIIHFNAPAEINRSRKTSVILFALPNGNTIDWTAGKKMQDTDDWHFDIQHIAAQTRWLRAHSRSENIIIAYLATRQKSWPAWKKNNPDYAIKIAQIISSVKHRFEDFKPSLTLSSHSGGGGFIFGYLDGAKVIDPEIERVSFIDSEYGYETEHAKKLTAWLKNKHHSLCALAYNDSVVIYNGKPLVSPTGGTWYRSKMMLSDMANSYKFKRNETENFLEADAEHRRIQFRLLKNPEGKIYHTEQVARNGFIFSCTTGTGKQKQVNYWGERIYEDFIRENAETGKW